MTFILDLAKCIMSQSLQALPVLQRGDEVAIRSALERYEDIDMNFAGSREAKLLKVRHPKQTERPADVVSGRLGSTWSLFT